MGDVPKGCSLDRINTYGDYLPENCRWATRKTQNNNARSNIVIEHLGEKLTLSQWSRRLNINYDTLRYRIVYYGWSPERALTEIP